MNILISTEINLKENLENIKKDTEKILSYLGLDNVEISILFVNDERIKKLNARYRNKNSVTDVLSFPQNEGILNNININILGDIVISYPQAVRQAPESENTVYEDIIVLIIHSILHLIGYDHLTEKDDKIMRKKEEDIFEFIFA